MLISERINRYLSKRKLKKQLRKAQLTKVAIYSLVLDGTWKKEDSHTLSEHSKVQSEIIKIKNKLQDAKNI